MNNPIDPRLTVKDLHVLLAHLSAENEQLRETVTTYRALSDQHLAIIRQLLNVKTLPNTQRKPR